MTQLVTKVGDVIGDWLLGSKKDFKEKIKSEISDRMINSEKTVKSTTKITGNTEGGKLSKGPKSSGGSADNIGSGSGSDSDSNKKSMKMNMNMNMNIQATEGTIVSTILDEVEEVVEIEQSIKKKDRKEKKKKGYFNMRNESKENGIYDEDKNINENKNTDENEIKDENKDKIEGKNKKNSQKIPGSKKKKKKKSSHKKNDRDGSPRVIFVCSGE